MARLGKWEIERETGAKTIGISTIIAISGDRVAHSECEGRGFDSRLAHQIENRWNFKVPAVFSLPENGRIFVSFCKF